jgi:hypothetical protein
LKTAGAIQCRFFSTDSDEEKAEWMQQLDDHIAKNDAEQAQDLLERIEQSATTDPEELDEARCKVLEAWISFQDECLEGYNAQEPDRVQLQAICTAAESAHDLLEKIEPSLARTNAVVSAMYGDVKSRVGIEVSEEEDASRRRRKAFNVVQTERCDAVLTAWARAVRAGHGFTTRITRGIPQRAQFLLEQMEATYANPEASVDSTVRATVGSYNRVLEAWAYSGEHLRGNMAERIFTNLSEGNVSGAKPNAESYRMVIWAWSLSRDGRAAFTATGHLTKMLRKLEHDEEMEPSLDDYHVVLKAWTRAEYVKMCCCSRLPC